MIIAAAILYAFVGHVLLTLSRDDHSAVERWVLVFFIVLWPLGLVLALVRATKEAAK